jgi:hypothetical protein
MSLLALVNQSISQMALTASSIHCMLQRIASVQRGQLQQLQKDASSFCGMVCSFSSKLNWFQLNTLCEYIDYVKTSKIFYAKGTRWRACWAPTRTD